MFLRVAGVKPETSLNFDSVLKSPATATVSWDGETMKRNRERRMREKREIGKERETSRTGRVSISTFSTCDRSLRSLRLVVSATTLRCTFIVSYKWNNVYVVRRLVCTGYPGNIGWYFRDGSSLRLRTNLSVVNMRRKDEAIARYSTRISFKRLNLRTIWCSTFDLKLTENAQNSMHRLTRGLLDKNN